MSRMSRRLAAIWLLAASVPAQTSAANEACARRAVTWLATHATGKGWRGVEVGNDGGRRLVATAAAALAVQLLPEPADPAWTAAARQWEEGLAEGVGGTAMSTAVFANWIDGVRAMACAEWSERHGRPHPLLARIATGFAHRQNAEGGWAHAEGTAASFYPSTLLASSNLALFVLGAARRAGIAVDAEVIDAGLALLADVQTAGGGFAYGGRDYRKGIEVGRTCGAVLAYAALQQQAVPGFALAIGYVRRNRAAIPDGHASPSLHVMIGALASHVAGPQDWADFDRLVLTRVRAAQRPDGSFADIVEGSPDSLAIMGAPTVLDAYVTAAYTVALLAGSSALTTRWRGESPPVPVAAPLPRQQPTADPAWRAEVSGWRGAAVADERLFVLTATELRVLATATGRELGRYTVADGPEDAVTMVLGKHRLWATSDPRSATVVGGQLALAPTPRRPRLWQLRHDGVVEWTVELPFPATRVVEAGDRVVVGGASGRVLEFLILDGERLQEQPALGPGVNGFLAVAGDARIRSAEAKLVATRADGSELWRRRLRGRGGLTPPAVTGLLVDGDTLLVATSAGTLQRRRLADGEWLHEQRVAGGLASVLRVGAHLVKVAGDGHVVASASGTIAWHGDAAGGREPGAVRALADAGHVAVQVAGTLTVFAAADGAVVLSLSPAPPTWFLSGGGLITIASTAQPALVAGYRLAS